MTVILKSLNELTVQDIMSPRIWSVSQNATIAEAVELLVEHDISGLPVVDETGKCVGVLSNSDIVNRCYKNSQGGELSSVVDDVEVSHKGAFRSLQIEVVPEDRVARHMSTAVQTISADRPALEAARFLRDGNIHRLVVVDTRAYPMGVVSSVDILQACVKDDCVGTLPKDAVS